MKWIVFWIVSSYMMTPCDHINEFGLPGANHCMVAHYKEVVEAHFKEFDDRAEAFDFYDRGLSQKGGDYFGSPVSHISYIRIDSIYPRYLRDWEGFMFRDTFGIVDPAVNDTLSIRNGILKYAPDYQPKHH